MDHITCLQFKKISCSSKLNPDTPLIKIAIQIEKKKRNERIVERDRVEKGITTNQGVVFR